MLKRGMAALLALAALSLAAVPASAGKPTGTEFKDGWTTFATAKEGDWIEYQINEKMVRRVEVKAVSGDKITTVETMVTDGKAADPKEKKPLEWWLQKLPAMLPTNMSITWSKEEVKVGGATLQCDVASWTNGTLSNALYFCKEVRCGGYLKMDIGGKVSVWTKNYGDKDHKEGFLKQVEDPNAGKGPSLPGFYSQAGNTAVFKTKSGDREWFTLRECTSFDGVTATISDTPCDKNGVTEQNATPIISKWTNEAWAKLYPKPSATDEKVKVTAGEFVCALYESTEGTVTKKEWLTPEGLVAKSEVKDGDKLSTTELIVMKLK